MSTDNFDWNNKTWNVINLIFKDKKNLIAHHLNSFNEFIDISLPSIIKEQNPITIFSHEDNSDIPLYKYEIEFGEIYLSKPIINEK